MVVTLRSQTVYQQLTPFDTVPTGALYLLLHEAIEHKKRSWYQPPRWDHEPTEEERKAEKQYLEDCEEAAEDAEFMAAQIFYAITGKEPHVEN